MILTSSRWVPHRCRGAPLKLCLAGDFYLVLRLGKLNDLVTVQNPHCTNKPVV